MNYLNKIKSLEISVLHITRLLNDEELEFLNNRGSRFSERTIQMYFDKNFELNSSDAEFVLEKVEIIIKHNEISNKELIKKLKK